MFCVCCLRLVWCATVRIGADEEVDNMQGLKPEEINKQIREKEAKVPAGLRQMDVGCEQFKRLQKTYLFGR